MDGLSLLGLAFLLTTCLLTPVHIYAAATVNNDAAGVAAGAFAWLVASTTGRLRSSTAAGIGLTVGALLVMIKGIFIVAPFVLVVATVLREQPWSSARGGWRFMVRRNAGVVGMLAGAGVAFVAWIEIQNVRAQVPSSVVLEALLGFTRTDHLKLQSILIGLRGLTSMFVPYFGDSPTHYLWNLTFFAVVIGVVILRVPSAETSDTRLLSIASMAGVVAVSVGWTVLSYLQGHYDGVATPRYGLSLLPIMAIVVVRSVPRAGLLVLSLLFPVAGVMWQLSGKF
jgi:hypothetical protein